jgi:broad specificity phosphatase PhoE
MSTDSQEVVLVRHGETEWSRAGKHTGRTNIPLTERGRREARAVGAELQGRQFALVLTSPLARAADTCRLAGFGDAAVFAHGHLLRVLATRWLGLEPAAGRLFALDAATISILGYERETPVVRMWNRSVP